MTIGFCNVNGWSANSLSENHIFRESCLNILNFDIICIAETHLLPEQEIDLMNCSFFGHNRHFSLLNVNFACACGYDFVCDGRRLVRAYLRRRRGEI